MSQAQRSARVLLVDDDDTFRRVMSGELSRRGYSVTTAASGEAGLKLALGGGVDVVMLDLRLPDMDGIEVFKHLRSHDATLEVVVLTDSTVMILGETGVGKEMVAMLMHARSQRRDSPFVVVDCATLHDDLLQSELFGHEKGLHRRHPSEARSVRGGSRTPRPRAWRARTPRAGSPARTP